MLTSDGDKVEKVNPAMLEFVGYDTLGEFQRKHNCICDFFLEEKLCLKAQMGDENWLEYILARPNLLHKACMQKDGKRHIFVVWAEKLHLDERERSVISFNDITQLEEIKERYEYAIYGAEDGLWDWDMQKNTVYFSPRWKAMLGLGDDEKLTDSFKEFESRVHPKDLEKVIKSIQKHVEDSNPYKETVRMKHKNGSWIWILTRGKVVERSQDGIPLRMVGTHTDVTKTKELEQKLYSARLEFDMFMYYIPAAILIKDTDGVILFANKAANNFFAQEDIIGKKAQDLLPPDKVKETEEFAKKVIENGQYENINEFYNYNEDKVFVRTLGFKIEIENTIQIGLVIIDITQSYMDKKALEGKEEIMISQSRHAAMGEMISMIAHQWRQPISVISMDANNILADIELETLENKTLSEDAQNILKQTQELSKTIDDFRDFFKPSKLTEEMWPQDILKEALGVIGKSLENNNIEIVTEFQINKQINTYSRELMQVIINLLKNAKEVLSENKVENKKIYIKIVDKENKVCIKVCDNGGGVKEEIQNQIFNPYFTTKKSSSGTGLGLYMSKTIIEKHLNGTLIVKNEDAGACFEITVPYTLEGKLV